MHGAVRKVNARMLGQRPRLMSDDIREWNLNQLLFADNTTMMVDSQDRLRQLGEEFGRLCERRKQRVNESKSKMMNYTRMEDDRRMNIILNVKLLEEVEYFKYLRSQIVLNGER